MYGDVPRVRIPPSPPYARCARFGGARGIRALVLNALALTTNDESLASCLDSTHPAGSTRPAGCGWLGGAVWFFGVGGGGDFWWRRGWGRAGAGEFGCWGARGGRGADWGAAAQQGGGAARGWSRWIGLDSSLATLRVGFGVFALPIGREGAGRGRLGKCNVARFLNEAWGGLRVDSRSPGRLRGLARDRTRVNLGHVERERIEHVKMGEPGKSFACAATDGPRLGLRGALGGAIPLSGGLHLAPEVLLEGDQLSTDGIGRCVAGPGTVGSSRFASASSSARRHPPRPLRARGAFSNRPASETPGLWFGLAPVVRSFLGDDHIVHVALAEALRSDPDEATLLPEIQNRSRMRCIPCPSEGRRRAGRGFEVSEPR